MSDKLKFVDLFAGGGGLSEGFIQEGYEPVAHVEADAAACNTLRTRMAYHWLAAAGREDLYADYLAGGVDRDVLYAQVPRRVLRSVINEEIRPGSLGRIYREIDSLLGGREGLRRAPEPEARGAGRASRRRRGYVSGAGTVDGGGDRERDLRRPAPAQRPPV